MVNDRPHAPDQRGSLEPDEPWRVEPRVSHRRPRDRRWAAPVVIGGLVAVAGLTGMLQLGHWPNSRAPSNSAQPVSAETRVAAPSAPEVVARHPVSTPSASPHPQRPAVHDGGHHAGRTDTAPPTPDFMSRSEPRKPRFRAPGEKPRERADRLRPRSGKHVYESRRGRRTPAWVRKECRRRFPDDRTRQAACVWALRGYFG